MKPTLSNPSLGGEPAGAFWIRCVGCGRLAALPPGQDRCADRANAGAVRCLAAHPDDPSSCEGPCDAVRAVDRTGEAALGCVHHAAILLASVTDARVYPATVDGAAIEVYRRAVVRAPFDFTVAGDRSRGWS